MKTLFRQLTSTTICLIMMPVILMPSGLAEAGPSYRDGAPGLDISYSPSYSSQQSMREFHRDVEVFQKGEEAPEQVLDGEIRNGVFVPSGQAEAVETAPAFKFHSGFSHAVVYQSNIYHTRLDEIDDLVTLPNVWMGVSRGRQGVDNTYFETSYGVGYIDYVENDKFDRMAHDLYTRVDWHGAKWSLGIENELRPLSPVGTANRRELRAAGGVNSVLATSNNFKFKTGYQISPKLRFDHTWAHTLVHYPPGFKGGSEGLERQSNQVHSFTPRLSYALTPKTNVFTFYQFDTADYFKGGTFAYKSHTAQAGFRTAFTPKIAYQFQAGYKIRDFNQPFFKGSGLFVYQTALNYEVNPRLVLSTHFGGNAGHGPDTSDPLDASPSEAGNGINSKSLGFGLNWAMSPVMRVAVSGAVQLESHSGQITLPDADNPAINFTRQLENVNYSWGIGWNYARSGFDRYSIGYQYSNKNSSFKDFETEDHTIVAAVNLNLDAMGGGGYAH